MLKGRGLLAWQLAISGLPDHASSVASVAAIPRGAALQTTEWCLLASAERNNPGW